MLCTPYPQLHYHRDVLVVVVVVIVGQCPLAVFGSTVQKLHWARE